MTVDAAFIRGHQILSRRTRPLVVGLSVGTRYGSGAGTLGYFVTVRERAGFLSAASVFAAHPAAERGDLVFQPSSLDSGTLKRSDAIGHLEDFTDFTSKDYHEIDAALVVLYEEIATAGNVLPSLDGCPYAGKNLSQPVRPDGLIKARVGKIGRSTGYTEAILSAVYPDEVRIAHDRQPLVFRDLIEITSDANEPFCQMGDSGAVVFTVPDLRPVGLLIAAGYATGVGGEPRLLAYACRIDKTLVLPCHVLFG